MFISSWMGMIWIASAAFFGLGIYVSNVDDTTLCTPMLNAQFDG